MGRRVAPSCGRSLKLLAVLLQQTSFHFVAPHAIPQFLSFYIYVINLLSQVLIHLVLIHIRIHLY